jgi:hypothetical protein
LAVGDGVAVGATVGVAVAGGLVAVGAGVEVGSTFGVGVGAGAAAWQATSSTLASATRARVKAGDTILLKFSLLLNGSPGAADHW